MLTMILTPLFTTDFAMLPFALFNKPFLARCLMGSVISWYCHLFPGFEFPRLVTSRSYQDAAVGESARLFMSKFESLEHSCISY